MEFNLNNFTTLKKQHAGNGIKATKPLVSMNKSGFTFNSYISKNTDILKDFCEIKVDVASGKLAFVFLPAATDESYKVNIRRSNVAYSGTAVIASKPIIRWFNSETDFVNTDIYRYRFEAEISEDQGIIMINLRDPYIKTKLAK